MSKIEGVVYKCGANHLVGFEGVGGMLYLTNDSLIFVSHALNIQRHQLNIPLVDIVGIEASNTWGFIPNGLTVCTISGTKEKFVVYRRKVWVERVNALRNA